MYILLEIESHSVCVCVGGGGHAVEATLPHEH